MKNTHILQLTLSLWNNNLDLQQNANTGTTLKPKVQRISTAQFEIGKLHQNTDKHIKIKC